MRRTVNRSIAGLLICLAALTLLSAAKKSRRGGETTKHPKSDGHSYIWHDPGRISSLNLYYGVGGNEHEPAPGPFKFIKEDTKGTAPKFDIRDSNGVEWRAKLRIDAKTDTAASRLLWAVGYFVTENYYLPQVQVQGLDKRSLSRGLRYISNDGVMHGARLKLHDKSEKKEANWSWFQNPFLGTREFNGLRVMIALINNWDLKEINNGIMKEKDGDLHYVVTDLDASFGKTGNYFTRSRGVLKDYLQSRFVQRVNHDSVDFILSSRSFILSAPDFPNYVTRTKMQEIAKNIPLQDARWIGGLLGQLSAQQISDAFRASGFSPQEVQGYTQVVRERIAELNKL
ncbi:MAG TPA: hypothetical protein VG028_18910 [Terriglobia bacterium]|nr:hypothetical protein [Terriglobia bacterium]